MIDGVITLINYFHLVSAGNYRRLVMTLVKLGEKLTLKVEGKGCYYEL